MVVCEICKKEYKLITKTHINKHGISLDEYLSNYPNSPLICEDTLKKHSEATKRYNEENGSPNKGIPKSKEHIENLKKAAKNRTKEHYQKIANNKERNKKISDAKKDWWKDKSEEYKSDFIKNKVIPKIIENEGKDSYLKRLRAAGILGHNKVRSQGKSKIANLFEKQMIARIKDKNYECIEQFEIDGYFYDAYIPEKNLILEFDGDYWHPNTVENCVSDRLTNQWRIDRYKESLAIKKGYQIKRIRESEKDRINEILQ